MMKIGREFLYALSKLFLAVFLVYFAEQYHLGKAHFGFMMVFIFEHNYHFMFYVNETSHFKAIRSKEISVYSLPVKPCL